MWTMSAPVWCPTSGSYGQTYGWMPNRVGAPPPVVPMPSLPQVPLTDPTKGYAEFADVKKARASAIAKFDFAMKLAGAALSSHSDQAAAIKELETAKTYWQVVVDKTKAVDTDLKATDPAWGDKHQVALNLMLEGNQHIEASNQTIGQLGQDKALTTPTIPPVYNPPPGTVTSPGPQAEPPAQALEWGQIAGWTAVVGVVGWIFWRTVSGVH